MGCCFSDKKKDIISNKHNSIEISFNLSKIQNVHTFCFECKKNNMEENSNPTRIGYIFDNNSIKNLWICYECDNKHKFGVYESMDVLIDSYEYCSKNNILGGLKYGVINH